MGLLLRGTALQMYAVSFVQPNPMHHRLPTPYEIHARLLLHTDNRSYRRGAATPTARTDEALMASIAAC